MDATLKFVTHSLQEESVIAFDYTIPISPENMNNYYGVKKVTESIEKHHPNERFKFAIDEGKIESFLDQRGMKIVSHINHREIEKAFLLNENG